MISQFKKKTRSIRLYWRTLGLGGMIFYSVRRLIIPAGRLIPVKIKNGGTLHLRSHSSDTAIFSQIFIYRELDLELPSPPSVILDCGANIGLATLYFKLKYPRAKIISVEPEPSNFALLKKNTQPYEDVHLIQKGIWKSTCDLFLIDNGQGHSSIEVSETNPNKNVIGRIEAISINDVIKTYNLDGVDLLKMDIEGSEYVCFAAADTSWIKRVKCIAVEIHEYLKPGCTALINGTLAGRQHRLNGEYHTYTKAGDN